MVGSSGAAAYDQLRATNITTTLGEVWVMEGLWAAGWSSVGGRALPRGRRLSSP